MTEIAELRKELEKKDKEIAKLTQRINSLQYVVDDKKKNPTVRISSQIVHRGIIPADHMKAFLKHRALTIDGRKTKAQHPDYDIVLLHLTRISKRMTKAKIEHDGCMPKLRRGDRSNMYTTDDYEKFGDSIISSYFNENPYEKWDVNPTWDVFESHMIEEERNR